MIAEMGPGPIIKVTSTEMGTVPRNVQKWGLAPFFIYVPIFYLLKQHSGSDIIFPRSLYLDIKFFLCYLSITLRGQGGNVRKSMEMDN